MVNPNLTGMNSSDSSQEKPKNTSRMKGVEAVLIVTFALGAVVMASGTFAFSTVHYARKEDVALAHTALAPSYPPSGATSTPVAVTHVSTPSSVRALYMTSWVAGTPSLRNNVVADLETTSANALVID